MSNKETHIAAKSGNGEAFAFSQSLYPSPSVIETFEKYDPGAAKEILEMAKAEQAHSHKIESAECRRETITRIMGMPFGFILCVSVLGVGGFLLYTGHSLSGGSSVAVAFLMIIMTIVTGGRQQPRH